MKIHTLEKGFLAAGLVVLVACAAALVYATLGMGIHLPAVHGRIDPSAVRTTAPFDAPGVRQLDDGRYEAVIIGSAWRFEPESVRVPAGTEIVFTATTTDVIHGFNIEGTRLNMMLMPGHVSRNTYTFSEPGEYLLICHEYCGLGHHMMAGRIIVEDPAEFEEVG
ncbi:MAG TPA: cytochrome c oxidase subunit II [Longimicrobiales bacterium]|nr:cytochrome c oxidase subunit II [Longimicrobiales bacterium]